MQPLILTVEDNPDIRAFIRICLEGEDFRVIESSNGPDAIRKVREENPSLIILDIGIGQPDGLEVCRQIRTFSTTPIIVLTALSDEISEAMCLAAGANDFITKPVSLTILGLRVKNQLRWKTARYSEPATTLTARNLEINLVTRELKVGGTGVATTRIEFDLISLLMSEPDRVFTREQVCEAIGVSPEYSGNHVVDNHTSRLRTKIVSAGGPKTMPAIRGVGFRLF